MKIKRPLFIFALSVLMVIYGINTLPESILYCSLALFVLFTIFHKLTVNRYTHHLVLILLAALIGAGWFGVLKNNMSHKINGFAQLGNITIEGRVTAKDVLGYTNCYQIEVSEINNEKIRNFKVAVYTDDYLEEGDGIVLTGKLKSFTAKSNYLYNYSRGIFAYFYPEKLTKQTAQSPFSAFISQKRTVLIDNARKIFASDTVSTAIAMGLGEKYLLNDTTRQAFTTAGISHALVVSGLHIGIITAVLKCLMYLIPVRKKLKNIVLCVFVFLFMALIGFTPSVVRAGCLIIVATLARTFLKETDNYTVLAMVILVTLISNPYTAANYSLLLSYTAYFGVINGAQICADRNYGDVKTALMITVFAVLYTTPMLSLMGMDMTILSPVFNLLLTYVIMVVCVLSFFLPIVAGIPFIGYLTAISLAPVNDVFIRFLLWFTDFTQNNFSFAMIDTSTDIVRVMVFSALIAVFIAFVQLKNKRHRIIFILTVPIISDLCYNFMNGNAVTVKVFDGSSEPSYIIYADDKTYLVATENINQSTFKDAMEDVKIYKFDEIIFCSLKTADTEMYSQYSDKVTVVSKTENYIKDSFAINSFVRNRQMCCIIDIQGVKIGFNHNKADMSGKEIDLYFFGSSAPDNLDAENCYYFYPVIKKNGDLVAEKQAKELYDILEIKIRNGKYYVMEDVKNFGSGI